MSSAPPRRRSKILDVSTIDLENTTFSHALLCCGRRVWTSIRQSVGWERKKRERERYEEAERQWDRGENMKNEAEICTKNGLKERTATTSTFYSQQMHPCRGWRNSQGTKLPPNDAPCTSPRRRRRFPRLSRPVKTTSNSTLTNDSESPMPRFRRAVFRVRV